MRILDYNLPLVIIIKKTNMKYKLSILIIGLIIINACAPTTKVTGIWTSDKYKAEDFKKIAVIGISPNIKSKTVVENALIAKLKEIGYNAVSGSVILTPDMLKIKDKSVLEKELKKESIDGVLVISLLDIKEESYYVSGSTDYYRPMGPHYGSFYDYYYYNYDRVYSPGYYETSQQIFLESNFYSLNSDQLVQTIQSETIDPVDITDLAKSYSNVLIQQLVTGRVLKNKALIEKRKK